MYLAFLFLFAELSSLFRNFTIYLSLGLIGKCWIFWISLYFFFQLWYCLIIDLVLSIKQMLNIPLLTINPTSQLVDNQNQLFKLNLVHNWILWLIYRYFAQLDIWSIKDLFIIFLGFAVLWVKTRKFKTIFQI